MKKALSIILAFIIPSTVCITLFLVNRNRLQTVLFSFGTALQTQTTFSIQNYKSNNVFILQSDKKGKCLTLYRKQKDGQLLRYSIIDSTLQTFRTENNKWCLQRKSELPASPFEILTEWRSLWKKRTTSLSAFKAYADLFLSAFSTTNNDSAIILDYNAFPAVFVSLKQFLATEKRLFPQAENFGAEINYTLYPFRDAAANRSIADILSKAFREPYKEDFRVAITEYADSLQNYNIQVCTGLFGQFSKLRIYDESQCIFEIKKIK